jgi:hypothetical protein
MTRKILLASCLLGLGGLVVSSDVASARWSRGECVDAVQRMGNPYMPRGELRAAIQRCIEAGPDAILAQPSYNQPTYNQPSPNQYYGSYGQYGYGPGYIYAPR